jgi:hypothetical protein
VLEERLSVSDPARIGTTERTVVHAVSRLTPRSRRSKTLAVIGIGVAAMAVAGTGVAAAGPSKPAAPAAGTQSLGAYTRVIGTTVTLAPGGFSSAVASCPAGQLVFGGGESNSAPGTLVLTDSWPLSTTSWLVFVKSNDPATTHTFTVYATCGI